MPEELLTIEEVSYFEIDERVASLFQPDTVLPAQYLQTVSRKTHLEPEKKLMLAVLEDAVACFQKYGSVRDGKGKILFSEAEEWILLEHNDEWLFSFDNICEALGLNPGNVRKGLQRWWYHGLTGRDQARLRVNRSRYASRN